jgi:hypothetical protein
MQKLLESNMRANDVSFSFGFKQFMNKKKKYNTQITERIVSKKNL